MTSDRIFYPGDIVRDKESNRLGIVLKTIEHLPNKFNMAQIQVCVTVHQQDGCELTLPRRRFKRLALVREAMHGEQACHTGKLIREFMQEFKP